MIRRVYRVLLRNVGDGCSPDIRPRYQTRDTRNTRVTVANVGRRPGPLS